MEAAREEAGVRGEELARLVVEFEARAASAEVAMARRVSTILQYQYG